MTPPDRPHHLTLVIALFNSRGGVAKATMVYHLAHMVARQGHQTLAVDLDPQANLTSAFFDDGELEAILEAGQPTTVGDAVAPRLQGIGDIVVPELREAADGLWVLPGDLALASFEDALSDAWPRGCEGSEAALRTTTAFHRIIQGGAETVGADVVFVDVGLNLGAINRAALRAADHVVVPLAADLLGLRGLASAGPVLRRWRRTWRENVLPATDGLDLELPAGAIAPMGMSCCSRRRGWTARCRPTTASSRASPASSPAPCSRSSRPSPTPAAADPHCLARLRSYRSLTPLAQDARKPMFDLRAADGALGSTARLLSICFREFESLAAVVLQRAGLKVAA